MARKYGLHDYIIGDTSYHSTPDEAIARGVALVSSAYVSLGFHHMDAAAYHDGKTWFWGGWNDCDSLVLLAIVDELGRASDVSSFADYLSPDPQQWVTKLALTHEWQDAA